MKVPAAQASHVPWPVRGCLVPGLHGVGAVAPVEQNAPASHGVHSLLLPRPTALLYEPERHGSGALAPASQYEPGVQS